jgi:glutathione S-transferase
MKLYSGPVSLFTSKVRIALAEKELPYERVEVGWGLADAYLPHHPDVVRLNPKKQVPILVDGDVVLPDSTLILEYLEDRFPTPALYPTEPGAKAMCRRLEAAADEIVFPSVWTLIAEGLYPPGPEGRDEAALKTAREELAGHYRQLDEALEGRDYLCGDYSVADIATFVFVSAAAMLGAPVGDGCDRLQAWVGRVSSLPVVAAEIAAMQAVLADEMKALATAAA